MMCQLLMGPCCSVFRLADAVNEELVVFQHKSIINVKGKKIKSGI